MKKIATYVVALLVFVLAFFVLKFTSGLILGTFVRTVGLAAFALVVMGIGLLVFLRRR